MKHFTYCEHVFKIALRGGGKFPPVRRGGVGWLEDVKFCWEGFFIRWWEPEEERFSP